jgi:UrcA family protein
MLKTIPALAALVVAGALVLPTVTQAAESQSVHVSYADLNLASNAGQYALRGRIDEAARTVCGIEDSRELALASAVNLCRNGAVEGARPAYEAAVAAARHGTVTVLGASAIAVSAH